MAGDVITSEVLSDALRTAIGSGRAKAALFFTFCFDPGFFEEHVLPLLFDESFSHVRKIRLVQLQEALLGVNELAVYYDARALEAEGESARLDYARIGLMPTSGFFHPKNVFVLVEDDAGETAVERLVMMTASANLTRAGWWENVEVAHIEQITAGERCAFRPELLRFFARVRQFDRTGDHHLALDRIHKFVLDLDKYDRAPRGTRFYAGGEKLPEFLHRNVGTGWNLEIISPYFDNLTDNGEPAGALGDLLEMMRPTQTRVYLPFDGGIAGCAKEFYEAVAGQRDVHWSRLTGDLTRRGSTESGAAPRFVHAKVYRFWRDGEEFIFSGSANLTRPGHQAGGNVETGVLVRGESPRREWLLRRIEEEEPEDFAPEKEGEREVLTPYHVILRFDWQTRELSYFWESKAATPQRAEVLVAGVPCFAIEPIVANAWTSIAGVGERMPSLLETSSFVDVCAGGITFSVLIREEGMERRPSLLFTLTPEEILRYWSLLTQEQRQALLEEKASTMNIADQHALRARALPQTDSMFDRFAGIFHAFGRLEHCVRSALDARPPREKEAIYRLFGEKYDSLPTLLRHVVEDTEGDGVRRYLILLCALQLLRKVKRRYPDFERSELLRLLKGLHPDVAAAEKSFTFSTVSERRKFFAWFKKMFLADLTAKQMEAA